MLIDPFSREVSPKNLLKFRGNRQVFPADLTKFIEPRLKLCAEAFPSGLFLLFPHCSEKMARLANFYAINNVRHGAGDEHTVQTIVRQG